MQIIQQVGRVAVLMGGDSAEREVSLKSGRAALDALKRQGISAFSIDLRFKQGSDSKSICQQLTVQAFDIAFIALHGRGGEDGVIQGVLEALGIPYTGCRVAASAIAMDKLRTKLLWKGADLATPEFKLVNTSQLLLDTDCLLNEVMDLLVFPVMVKPAHEGSSIGMSKADDKLSLLTALKMAGQYDTEILVEQWIVGTEYTGAVLMTGLTTERMTKALPLIRLETPREFYDFQAKYVTDDTGYYCPSGLDDILEKRYQALVLDAFTCVGARGWGRVDFICDQQGQPWLIELNTVPGLTDHSLVPMAAHHYGIEFDQLIVQILYTALDHND
jgi:D-alanine-D-alanine ligase